MAETVTISKSEYERLKKLEKEQQEIIEDFKQSLKDVCAGRIKKRN